jgi:membrane protein YdbS with pleckstrin-like domain
MEPTAPVQTVADGVERQLDPRSIAVNRIGGWIFFGCISLLSLIGGIANALVSPMPLPLKAALLLGVWPLVSGGLAWLAHQWPVVEHRHSSYRVDEESIEIRRGVYWRHVIDVPRNRVQHTDVSQGPLERHFGLGTLVMFTAGTEHARVTLGGLDHALAIRIRDHLLATERADAV